MSDLAISIIGWVAASCTTISTIPQAVEVIRSRKTEGISLLMYILFVAGIGGWIAYGFLKQDPVLYSSNIVTFFFSSITLGFKIYNVAKGHEPFFNSAKKSEENK